MDLKQAASIEILANLLMDIDAYAEAMHNPSDEGKRASYTAYSLICDRITSLAELSGSTFGAVLSDKLRIQDELQADRDRR